MLTYAYACMRQRMRGVCVGRMLTYADVCLRLHAAAYARRMRWAIWDYSLYYYSLYYYSLYYYSLYYYSLYYYSLYYYSLYYYIVRCVGRMLTYADVC
jgi:hypothetical protein